MHAVQIIDIAKIKNMKREAPSIVELHIGDEPQVWKNLGFRVENKRCRVGTIDLVFDQGSKGPGIHSWVLQNAESPNFGSIKTMSQDFISTELALDHPNGCFGIDHVVLRVPEFGRGRIALEQIGALVGEPEAISKSGPTILRSAVNMGEVVVELIGPEQLDPIASWALWGLVMSVREVDECAKLLGPAVGKVKPAVQKNKCITTVRKEAGASAAIAFLGPPAK